MKEKCQIRSDGAQFNSSITNLVIFGSRPFNINKFSLKLPKCICKWQTFSGGNILGLENYFKRKKLTFKIYHYGVKKFHYGLVPDILRSLRCKNLMYNSNFEFQRTEVEILVKVFRPYLTLKRPLRRKLRMSRVFF